MVSFSIRCRMELDASVRLLMTVWCQIAFIVMSWKADDCFTISDYRLLCLAFEELHQHSRPEGE